MKKTVLIADDDPSMVQILRHILEFEGFKVISESNGRAALATAIQVRPDLLILDLTMPILDGMSVLRELYGSEIQFESPAILLTAQDPMQYKETAEAFGDVRFVEKPFELDNFIDIIRRYLK